MATAVQIVTNAMRSLNRLSPGETLNADDLAAGFEHLNLIVDTLSASKAFLYRTVITSAAQTGNITLAAGSWAAIPVGTRLMSVSVDGEEIPRITPEQYATEYDTTSSGSPTRWAQDGLASVQFVPVPNGQTIKVAHGVSVTTFADTTTDYTMPPGYKAYLGAAVAVKMAPVYNPQMLVALLREERAAAKAIAFVEPAIAQTLSYQMPRDRTSILQG